MACDRIALVSAPWPVFSRPSIQLGTLKAYLADVFPDLTVAAHHFYLSVADGIGYRQYQALSKKTWLAETVYAALLYPERLADIEKLYRKKQGRGSPLADVDLETIAGRVRDISDRFVRDVNWKEFRLVGFSVCLCQLTASLYLIRRIKAVSPDTAIVTGGSTLSLETGQGLMQVFPGIDAVVVGEGEKPLAGLIRYFREGGDNREIPAAPGVVTRQTPERTGTASFCQLGTMDDLPMPDYSDYFELLASLGAPATFFPTLPVEISRGCWWQSARPRGAGSFSGCAFCNLNRQWEGYRSKRPDRVVSEIDTLTIKHQSLSVAVMDNTPPVKTTPAAFASMTRLKRDFEIFCEVRASTTRQSLAVMKAAGLNSVQIGIEALSTGLLKKINKGATAIRNLEIMKNCEELGIANSSNLILCFPGSDEDDVAETLRNIEFAAFYRPLKLVTFSLGLGSPVSEDPRRFGIKAVYNHPHYAGLFPRHVCRTVPFATRAYRGDLTYQRKLWRPVRKRVSQWETSYKALHSAPSSLPVLSFRDGGAFLIIRERRPGEDPVLHRLTGISRSVYLYCRRHRSEKKILTHFPGLTAEKLRPFLKMMTDKRLMFEEDGKYLSLAVWVR